MRAVGSRKEGAAPVAGEVNAVVITQIDDCYSGNNLQYAQIFLNGTVVPPAATDTTPPTIAIDVDGTQGDNGRYVGDVDVTWTVTDDGFEVTSTTGCDATTIATDTAGMGLTCEATSAGGHRVRKRDATAPEATATRAPEANANGWNDTDVTVSFTVRTTWPTSPRATRMSSSARAPASPAAARVHPPLSPGDACPARTRSSGVSCEALLGAHGALLDATHCPVDIRFLSASLHILPACWIAALEWFVRIPYGALAPGDRRGMPTRSERKSR